MIKEKIIRYSLYVFILPIILLQISCSSSDSDGSLSYTDISVNTAINDTIPASGEKVYRFKTNAAGSYTISLTNLASDLGWSLYSYDPADKSLTTLFDNVIDGLNGDIYFDTTNEVFTESLGSDTYFYVVVDEWSNRSSSYTLQIVQ